MNKLNILLEHVDLNCNFYNSNIDECKYFDNCSVGVSCYGKVKNCEIEDVEKRVKEN